MRRMSSQCPYLLCALLEAAAWLTLGPASTSPQIVHQLLALLPEEVLQLPLLRLQLQGLDLQRIGHVSLFVLLLGALIVEVALHASSYLLEQLHIMPGTSASSWRATTVVHRLRLELHGSCPFGRLDSMWLARLKVRVAADFRWSHHKIRWIGKLKGARPVALQHLFTLPLKFKLVVLC